MLRRMASASSSYGLTSTLFHHFFKDRFGFDGLTELIVDTAQCGHGGDEARVDFQAVLEHGRRFLPHPGFYI